MPISQKKEVIIFKSIPTGLSELVCDLFPGSFLSTVVLPLNTIEQLTEHMLQQWLHKEELTRLVSFSHKKRHREWLGGRICAKQALFTYRNQRKPSSCHPEHHQFRILTTETGRPYFDRPEGMDFSMPALSISHSSNFAAAITSQTHCGIDIQYAAENLHRVKERFCTQEEEHLLHESLPHLSSLLQLTFLWSGKEAVKKMLSPFGIPGFQELHLQEIKQQRQSTTTLYFTKTDGSFDINTVAVGIYNTDYALALCCQQDTPPLSAIKKRTKNA